VREIAAALQAWGPFGAFLLAAIDSAGVPLPTGVDALVVASSILSPRTALLTALCATAGSAIGSMVLFYLSRKGGEAYLSRHTMSPRAQRFRNWFLHYGLLTVFIPALLPIPLPLKVFVISAGALGVRPLSFLLVTAAARTPRYFGLAWLGSRLGEESLPWLKEHAWEMMGFAAVLFAILYLMVKWKDYSRAGKSESAGIQ
jgi:membrane protein YqaA with SNARE-associated domain